MSRNTPFDAKISRPELPEVFVRRRLLRALEPAPGQRAIFINAPAGYGKTTLLASYSPITDHGAGSGAPDPQRPGGKDSVQTGR